MNLAHVLDLGRRDHLYPSVILTGGTAEVRQAAAVEIARVLLCEHGGERRGCPPGQRCRHCRRVAWPTKGEDGFHPDFHVLLRDLRTSTSIDATKTFLQQAFSSPFEARGQVFVFGEADSLGGAAADSLLKLLEEPPSRSPRHFLLLAANRAELPVTLRSRSLSAFLGSPEALDAAAIASLAADLARALNAFFAEGSVIDLLSAADLLGRGEGWEDPRSRRPWAIAASALLAYLEQNPLSPPIRRAVLTLAQELLEAPRWRMRGIGHSRILEGLLARHLPAALRRH